MEGCKKWTYDMVIFYETLGNKYSVCCLYSPTTWPNECYTWDTSSSTLDGLADGIVSYIKSNVGSGRHIHEDDFAILNLPRSTEEPGGDILDSHKGITPFIGMAPLIDSEFAYLQTRIGSEFPYIWGLPNRPYLDIPVITPQQAALEWGGLFTECIEAVKKLTGTDVQDRLPEDVKLFVDGYKRRN